MNSNYKYNKLYYALLTAGMVVSTSAQASEIEKNEKIENIIVTAQKRAQSLQEVPVSVSAIGEDTLENLKMDSAADISAQVPNLQVSTPYGDVQPIFSIRGISMVDYNTNQASPIGVYVDELAIGASFLQGLQLFDLERVEVLRGPQGTLYGKNTTGGAINVISIAPSFVEEATVTASVGNYGRRELKGAGEIQLIDDTLGARLAFTSSKVDGYHDNLLDGKEDLSETDNYALRFSMLYQNENFDATLRLSKGKSDANTLAVVPIMTGPGDANYLGGTRSSEYDSWEGEHNKAETFKVDSEGAALTMNFKMDDYTFTSITGYIKGDALNQADTDGSALRVLEIDFSSKSKQITQDFRLTSDFEGPFNFIAGVYYSSDTLDVANDYDLFFDSPYPFLTHPLAPIFIGQSFTQERETYAVYSNLDYQLSDDTTITMGLRYTEDKGELSNFNSFGGDTSRTKVFDLISLLPTKEYTDGEWTGKVGIAHNLNDNTLLYTNYSRGYRSSAFNGGAVVNEGDVNIASPEFVDAYELGLKTQFMGGSIQLNSALFSYDYTDQQFINVVGINQVLENAGSSKIYGLDLEMIMLVNDDLALSTGLGLVNTEFKELILNNPATGTDKDYSGNELQQAPKVNFNLSADYKVAELSIGGLSLHLGTTYQDEQYYSAYNDARGYENIRADSYWQSNVMLRFTSSDQSYSIALWAKNLEQNDEPAYALNLSQGYGYDYTAVGEPRLFGLDFTVNYF
jgi:iron complex outermembrane receptor protein